MTKRFWTPERKKDFYNLQAAREHRREYMRNYMQQARAAGKVKHWRQYLKEKLNVNELQKPNNKKQKEKK